MPTSTLADHHPDAVLKVAVYTGVAFERDAVSNSFVEKLRILTHLGEQGFPVEVTGFALASDCGHPAVRVVSGLSELMCRPEFAAADLHIFEFGMWYELINALFLVHGPSLVIDHNTTPPELIDDPTVKLACERSWLERHNLSLASHIATDGEFTRDELVRMGFDPGLISVLHLPPANAAPQRRRGHSAWVRHGAPVRLLYVGRFVRAKGIVDLLRAAERLWDNGMDGFTLTMAGSIRFADDATMAAVDEGLATHGASGRFTVNFDASDEGVAALFGEADALIMPSHHEGYCVPVIEAMTSDCYVVGSDAGNIPNVMGGLGTSFESGNIESLTRAMSRFVTAVEKARSGSGDLVLPTDSGGLKLAQWQQRVSAHLGEYSHSHYRQSFLQILARVLSTTPAGSPDWLAGLAREVAPVSARAS